MAPSIVFVPSLAELGRLPAGRIRDTCWEFFKLFRVVARALRELGELGLFDAGRASPLGPWLNRRWFALFCLPGDRYPLGEREDDKLVQLDCTAVEVYQYGFFSDEYAMLPQFIWAAQQMIQRLVLSTLRESEPARADINHETARGHWNRCSVSSGKDLTGIDGIPLLCGRLG